MKRKLIVATVLSTAFLGIGIVAFHPGNTLDKSIPYPLGNGNCQYADGVNRMCPKPKNFTQAAPIPHTGVMTIQTSPAPSTPPPAEGGSPAPEPNPGTPAPIDAGSPDAQAITPPAGPPPTSDTLIITMKPHGSN